MMPEGLSRRAVFAGLGTLVGPVFSKPSRRRNVTVHLRPEQSLGRTPRDFLGFGYEISSVATKGLLAPHNSALLQFVRALGPRGVIRIGGNTSDFSIWKPTGTPASVPKGTVTNKASIHDLGGFLHATGWDLIWGLNLGTGTPEAGADQAWEVARAAGNRLLAVQIGNEPDLFVNQGHRTKGYGYEQFRREFEQFALVARQRTAGLPLAGPDVAASPDWVTAFSKDEGQTVRLLTEHYYALGPPESPRTTIENLLRTDPGFLRMTNQLAAASRASGVSYRLVELNSCFGGGKAGVSDTFASALWGLDLMFTLALAGGSGINWQTGVNHLGRISSYSPIWDDERGHYSARPLYYALLAFSVAGVGTRFSVGADPAGGLITIYGVKKDTGPTWVTAINKDVNTGAEVRLSSSQPFSKAELLELHAPAVDSNENVTLGRSAVSDQGHWRAGEAETIGSRRGEFRFYVAPASAALVRLS